LTILGLIPVEDKQVFRSSKRSALLWGTFGLWMGNGFHPWR